MGKLDATIAKRFSIETDNTIVEKLSVIFAIFIVLFSIEGSLNTPKNNAIMKEKQIQKTLVIVVFVRFLLNY